MALCSSSSVRMLPKMRTVQRAVTARRAVTPPGIVGTRCVRGLVGSSSGAREAPRRVFLHVQLVLSQSQGRTGCPRVVQRFVKSPSPRKLSVLNSRRSTSDRDFYTPGRKSLQEIKTKMTRNRSLPLGRQKRRGQTDSHHQDGRAGVRGGEEYIIQRGFSIFT